MRMWAFKGELTPKAWPSANHGEKARFDERPRGMFYCGPTVGARCTYQNPKLAHVKLEVAKAGSWTSHIGFEKGLC